ncbi:MAG: NAD(P)-dependent alcohol dehydrogenase [Candidatus Thorarchaeota archaeon]|nr:NAD(P)-dependent alcohol dehydrogenase [Candidatus Thorarchaeota archaeon]
MKAAVVEKYGSPEGLRIREVETPMPKDNELLVKINATTVTYGDAALRRMKFPSRIVFGLFLGGLGKNKILGHELAGEVETVGDQVTLFKEGDQVFASTGMTGGAHAEYICLPEDAMITGKPANMTFEDAAAVPVGGNTALHILRKANIQSGHKVLIYGASGSVGTYAVQLAKYWGAEVTGVCSTSNLEWVRDLGADKMIDYKTEDFTAIGETYDVIFDAVRKISSSQCKGLLKENGVFLSTRSPTDEKAENLVFLRGLIEEGKLKSVIDRRYPLENIVDAHFYVDQGHKKGNIVIVVNPDSKVV